MIDWVTRPLRRGGAGVSVKIGGELCTLVRKSPTAHFGDGDCLRHGSDRGWPRIRTQNPPVEPVTIYVTLTP